MGRYRNRSDDIREGRSLRSSSSSTALAATRRESGGGGEGSGGKRSREDRDSQQHHQHQQQKLSRRSHATAPRTREELEELHIAAVAAAAPPATATVEPIDALEDRIRCLVRAFEATKTDLEQRRMTIASMERCLANTPLEADLFGSGRTGLALPKSDLDFSVYLRPPPTASPSNANGGSPTPSERSGTPLRGLFHGGNGPRAFLTRKERQRQGAQEINIFTRILRENREFTVLSRIAHARVPIVKCVHRATQVPVDVSFTTDGIATSEYLVKKLSAVPPPGAAGAPLFEDTTGEAFEPQEQHAASSTTSTTAPTSPSELVRAIGRPLILLFKHLMHLWGLGDASVGGLGSFAQSLLVIYFIETQAVRYPPEQRNSLFYTFLGLLHFYKEFNYVGEGISISNRGTFRKPPIGQIMVMNPIDGTKNAASACTRFSSVQQRVGDAYDSLSRALQAAKASTAISAFDEVFGLSAKSRFCATEEVITRFERVHRHRGMRTSGDVVPASQSSSSPIAKRGRGGAADSHSQLLGAAVVGDFAPGDVAHFARHGVLPGGSPVVSNDPRRHQRESDALLQKRVRREFELGSNGAPAAAAAGAMSPPPQTVASTPTASTPASQQQLLQLRAPVAASPASRNLFTGRYLN